jgi:hypothetical protein
VIPHPGHDPGLRDQRPDITIGKPIKVGKYCVHIPVSITLPGTNRATTFSVIIDLNPSTDKKI